ncbi:MAG: hypothetical protein GX631_03080, partial [Dehalococcoidales bacterium]|nr:hypothetical protein [Dehalococcoidales bacterium]
VDVASFNVDCFYDGTYIDLLDFVDQVRKTTPYTAVAEAAVAVKIVLVGDETLTTHPVIVSNVFGSDHPFAYGLSIYLPYPPDFSVPEPGYTSLALAEDTLWDEFINWYLSGGVIEPEWVELTADARGDVTTGVVDIYGVDFFKRLDILKSAYASGSIAFRVRSDVSLADTWASTGMTLLDTDRNPATGETGFGHDIGADYSLDVYYDDTIGGLSGEIWKWDDAAGGWSSGPVGDFPVFTGMTDDGQTYYWMMVDFPVIGETDGFMDVVQVIDVYEYGMDKAPDTGHVSIAPRTTSDAVEDGLAWLVSQQNTDGSWGSLDSDHRLGETALAVYKLEQYAHDLEVSPLSVDYLYRQAVIDGLDFVLGYGTIVDISNPQPNQAPDYTDYSPIGQGISFDCDPGLFHSYETYYTSISAMAIAALGNLDYTYTANASSPLYGMNYHDILANVVDFLAWGQSDYSWARGGWNYERMDNDSDYIRSDESNTGWVTLALAHAEEHGILTPGWVRSELERWVTYIQEPSTGEGTGGGAYYTGVDDGMGVNALRTGNLLQQFAFLGDTAITPRVQLSLDYLSRVWNDWETAGPEVMLEGWYYGGYTPSFYHATYTIMKGLEAFGLAELPGPIDWYADFNTALLAEQNPDGSWPLSSFDQGDGVLSTVWALLTLEKDIPLTREGPDLTSLGIFPGWVSEQDGTYDVIVPLINKGNVAVSAGIIVDIYVNGVLQDTQTTPMPMIPGDPPIHMVFGPFTRDSQRDYDTIVITIDPANEVPELNEDNNSFREDYPSKPDLIIKEKWEEWVNDADPSEGYTVH